MALILYSNGLTEIYKPKNSIFSEEELVSLFSEFSEIKTVRLNSILNAWCIYGYSKNEDLIDFNRIASDIIKESIYSHVLYVHDSELNTKWNVTDFVISKNYNEFLDEIKKYIDIIAKTILQEYEENEQTADIIPQLITMGSTIDKRILFLFDPEEQSKEFYENEEFYRFSQRVYEYISNNKQEKEPFTIYSDKKAMIIVNTSNVKTFLNTILEKFKSKEEYEICTDISKIIDKWTPKKEKIKRKYVRKNKNENK